jgi:hypothetical protein
MKQCAKCWWIPICKKTKKACHLIQGIDMRWEESPNNRKSGVGLEAKKNEAYGL